jgi:mono/diheme cytochrome c family protein
MGSALYAGRRGVCLGLFARVLAQHGASRLTVPTIVTCSSPRSVTRWHFNKFAAASGRIGMLVTKNIWQTVCRVVDLGAGVVVACVVVAWGAAAQAPSQSGGSDQPLPALIRSVKGPDLFREYCAPCHGVEARGNGPVASALKVKVADLTILAKKNGGTFPASQVRKTIVGDDAVQAHGSREMPVWGPIFHQVEEDVDRGNVRIDNLVKYIASIQAAK